MAVQRFKFWIYPVSLKALQKVKGEDDRSLALQRYDCKSDLVCLAAETIISDE